MRRKFLITPEMCFSHLKMFTKFRKLFLLCFTLMCMQNVHREIKIYSYNEDEFIFKIDTNIYETFLENSII